MQSGTPRGEYIEPLMKEWSIHHDYAIVLYVYMYAYDISL